MYFPAHRPAYAQGEVVPSPRSRRNRVGLHTVAVDGGHKKLEHIEYALTRAPRIERGFGGAGRIHVPGEDREALVLSHTLGSGDRIHLRRREEGHEIPLGNWRSDSGEKSTDEGGPGSRHSLVELVEAGKKHHLRGLGPRY